MYIAELKGKLSSSTEKMEDILTSNVFSFFKYSKRTLFLKSLLQEIDINITDDELEEADFIFWPQFDNSTEPDVVIIAGNYYILFEAKLYSDFGQESSTSKAQLIREIEGGLNESKKLKKVFVLVAITEDYYYKQHKFKDIRKYKKLFNWINWQTVSKILIKLIEQFNNKLPDYLFAKDLSDLLERKKLRTFRSFNDIIFKPVKYFSKEIFLPIESTYHVENFIGFKDLLLNSESIEILPYSIFYSKKYFRNLKIPNLNNNLQKIFYKSEVKNEY